MSCLISEHYVNACPINQQQCHWNVISGPLACPFRACPNRARHRTRSLQVYELSYAAPVGSAASRCCYVKYPVCALGRCTALEGFLHLRIEERDQAIQAAHQRAHDPRRICVLFRLVALSAPRRDRAIQQHHEGQ